MEDNKAKFGVMSNILFTLKNIVRLDKVLLLAMIAMIFAMVVQPLLTIFMPKLIIQYFEESRPIEDMMVLIGCFIVASLIIGHIRSFADGFYPRKKSFYRSMKLGAEACMAALYADYKYISSEQGQLEMQKARYAMNRPAKGVEDIIVRIVECSANLFGAIVYIFILSTLNIWIIVALISCGVISFFFGSQVNKYREKHKDDISRVENKRFYVVETARDLKQAKDIRMYGVYHWLKDLGETYVEDKLFWERKITGKVFISSLVDGIIAFLRDGFAYVFLILMVINQKINVSEFILYIGSITGFSVWVSNFVKNSILMGTASIEVSEFRLFTEKALESSTNSLPRVDLKQPISIELKDICFSYGEKVIFDHFNLKIDAGKNVALVGINGAGKSTLVKLILNLLEPDSGQILINGIDLKSIDKQQFFEQFSVAFQDAFVLAYEMDINIAMTARDDIDQDKVDRVIKQAGLEAKVKSLEFGKRTFCEKLLDPDGIELSGGERQKVVLARALYKDAPVLILDEPSAALDPIAEAELYEKYHEMTENKTSIYISHRLSSTKFCDEVLLLEQGKIAERGTHHQLMALNGHYAKMFNVQSHYYNEEKVEVN